MGIQRYQIPNKEHDPILQEEVEAAVKELKIENRLR